MAANDANGAAVLPLPLDSVNEDIEAALDDFLLQLPSFDDDTDVLGGGAPLPPVITTAERPADAFLCILSPFAGEHAERGGAVRHAAAQQPRRAGVRG